MPAEYPPHPVPAASALVYNNNGKILLIQRKLEPGAGKWSLPGGKVELGETARAAAVRETFEESGIRVETEKLLDAVDVIITDDKMRTRYHFLILVYLARYVSGRLQESPETMDARWVPLKEALEYDLTSTAHTVIESFIVELKIRI
ncbi:NUDIX hydrolase [Desulfotruncus alcoholivorax]|uniref:NUDIX hydrolase n=1 Tax=Desulfotruncus alcoholivorax TaxID=265477 RepID=UPI0004023B66|nr:NUDIX hydrolase [Desulfotruncus alcoholivorax]